MTQPFPGYPSEPNEPKKTRKSTIVITALIAIALVLLSCVCGALAIKPDTTRGTSQKLYIKPSPSISQSLPANTIPEGTWQAGIDFPLGTYDLKSDVDACYWDVKVGDNYIGQGFDKGHWTFTFTAGQIIKTQACGSWIKVN